MKDKLEKLQIEEKNLLDKHKDKHFKTEEEGNLYIQENQSELIRLNELSDEIRELKWELMTKEERKTQLEIERKMKEKYSED